jgi:hypothetical protein
MQIVRRQGTSGTLEVIHTLPAPVTSARHLRAALTRAACRLFGRESRDWRLVHEPQTLFGGYIKALAASGCAGDTLEIR